MPLRFLIKTAITLVTPPVVFHSFPLPVTQCLMQRPGHPSHGQVKQNVDRWLFVWMGGGGIKNKNFFFIILIYHGATF